jgi:hypothetical protein
VPRVDRACRAQVVHGHYEGQYGDCQKCQLGLSLAHLDIWRRMIAARTPRAWIFEDDVVFHQDFHLLFPKYWQQVPEDAVLVWVGYSRTDQSFYCRWVGGPPRPLLHAALARSPPRGDAACAAASGRRQPMAGRPLGWRSLDGLLQSDACLLRQAAGSRCRHLARPTASPLASAAPGRKPADADVTEPQEVQLGAGAPWMTHALVVTLAGARLLEREMSELLRGNESLPGAPSRLDPEKVGEQRSCRACQRHTTQLLCRPRSARASAASTLPSRTRQRGVMMALLTLLTSPHGRGR